MVVSGYDYYREITIDNTKVDATLSNYPVMVKLDADNFDFSKVLTTGLDIVFSDASDNLLDFEMDYFDAIEKVAVFHVRVPAVSATVDTKIKMHYGKVGATDQSNKTGVWDSNYLCVIHLDSNAEDSTGNGKDGTISGATETDGLNGRALSFDGSDDKVLLPSLQTSATELTFQNIAKMDTGTSGEKRWSFAANAPFLIFRYNLPSNGDFQTLVGSTSISYSSAPMTNWHHVAITAKENDAQELWFNGASKGSVALGAFTTPPDPNDNYIASDRRGTGNRWPGIGDEFRASNVVRSDAWIKADDYNLRLNTLLAVGSEQGDTPPPTATRRYVQLI